MTCQPSPLKLYSTSTSSMKRNPLLPALSCHEGIALTGSATILMYFADVSGNEIPHCLSPLGSPFPSTSYSAFATSVKSVPFSDVRMVRAARLKMSSYLITTVLTSILIADLTNRKSVSSRYINMLQRPSPCWLKC
jgi:hypothetical protein